MTDGQDHFEPALDPQTQGPQLAPTAESVPIERAPVAPETLGYARPTLEPPESDLWILLKVSGPIMVATVSQTVMRFVD